MAPRRKRKANVESAEEIDKSPVKVSKQEASKDKEQKDGLQLVIEHW